MTFTQKQSEKLYKFWFEHTESLCQCCTDKPNVCKECSIDEVVDCSKCDLLRDTPCYNCFHLSLDADSFKWNGEVL